MGGKACFRGSDLGLQRPEVEEGSAVGAGGNAVGGIGAHDGLGRGQNGIIHIGFHRILGGVERVGIPQGHIGGLVGNVFLVALEVRNGIGIVEDHGLERLCIEIGSEVGPL